MRKKHTYEKGAVILLYVVIISVIAALLLAIAQSRLLLAFRRNQSSADSLIALYQSESIANDYLARLVGGYLGEDSFPFTDTFELSNSNVEVVGEQDGDVQKIVVTTKRGLAVSTVEGIREIQSLGQYEDVDIILSLDCTGSMDAGARCSDCFESPTRLDAQKDAAINFIETIRDSDASDKFRVGIMVFGIDAKWLQFEGQDVKPNGLLDYNDILVALDNEFSATRKESPACTRVMDATSVGSPYEASHQYFSSTKTDETKQIEVVITDGIPNSRQPSDLCSPDAFCPAFPVNAENQNYCYDNEYGWDCYEGSSYQDNSVDENRFNSIAYTTCEPLGKDYLRCALATSDTFVPQLGSEGIRDPDVDAYAVTIYNSPPSDVVNIFRRYASPDGYYNAARADQLTSVLEEVLKQILAERSVIQLNKLIPSIE